MSNQIEITLKRSIIGRNEKQKQTVRTLGLKKINDKVVHTATPAIRGMVEKVSHLVSVEER